jgi:ketopantoate reductase
MKKYRIAIVGLGATGTVIAAALLRKDPRMILVGRSDGMGETLLKKGIRVSGAISYFVPVGKLLQQHSGSWQVQPQSYLHQYKDL